jgi:hypothetical protein
LIIAMVCQQLSHLGFQVFLIIAVLFSIVVHCFVYSSTRWLLVKLLAIHRLMLFLIAMRFFVRPLLLTMKWMVGQIVMHFSRRVGRDNGLLDAAGSAWQSETRTMRHVVLACDVTVKFISHLCSSVEYHAAINH